MECRTYSVKETSKLLGVSEPSIYRWCEKGLIPHVRIFGRILILRSDLEELLEVNRNDGSNAGSAQTQRTGSGGGNGKSNSHQR